MKKLSKNIAIDDEQGTTVEEHFKTIMLDKNLIDEDYVKVTVDDLPSWFDEDLFKRGQDYYIKNVLSFNLAYLIGLMSVFLVPTIANILILTKQSSTPCVASKRYLQTTLHVFKLHEFNVKDSKSKFYKSLNTIRWKHATVSKRTKANNEFPQEGISQKDMVLTQFGFVGYVLVKSELLGFTNEINDREAFNHFWRVVGYLLGIPNRLNLCRKNEFETTLLCEKIMNHVMIKSLENPTPEFHFLTETSVQGLRSIDPTLDTDAFYKIFHEVHGCTYQKPVSIYSNVIYLYKKFILASFKLPVIGQISRILLNKYVKLLLWFSEHYPILAWMKYGRKQSQINLYPYSTI